MNKLVAVIKKLAIEMILNDEMKVKIVEALNKKINIPLISEKTEAELMEALYDSMQEALADALDDA